MLPEGWTLARLGGYCCERVERANTENFPVLSVTKDRGLILQSEKFKKRIASAETQRYLVCRRGDFCYDPMLLWSGAINRMERFEAGIISPAYNVFSVSDEVDHSYLIRLLRSAALLRQYRNISNGTNIRRQMVEELLTRGMPGRHSRFKMTEIGELPESWEVVTVEAIAHVIRGASPRPRADPRYYGGPVPRLMVEDVTRDGMFVTPRVDSLTHEGAKLSRPMPAGSLTIVCSGSVGVPSILAVDACIHDGFLGLREIKPTVLRDYLYFFFAARRAVFERDATHGGVFTNLTTEILRNFKIALPPSGEQEEICDHLRALQGTLASAMAARTQASQTQAALSSDLLTGKRRVRS